MRLAFDDIVIDNDRHELHRDGELMHVERRVFGLLVYLAMNPQRVISQEELLQTVWGGRVVSDTTIAGCIKHARKAIGDDGDRQVFIRTVRGCGFRLCAEVSLSGYEVHRAQHSSIEEPASVASTPAGSSELPGETREPVDIAGFNPSLIVQQLRCFSQSVELRPFVQSVSLALTTVLARIPLLRLGPVATGTLTPREIHESTGADYVLSGSARISDEHVHVVVQLSDACTGFNLWAHQLRIPGAPESAQESTVLAIVARLEPQLHRAMYDTVRSLDSAPNALELYLRASGLLALKGWHHESFTIASELLRRSWKQAPDFAHASSYLSLVLGLGCRLGLMDDHTQVRDEALEAAECSLQLETMDSAVLGMAGCALGDLGQPARAVSILKRAVELDPVNGQAWSALGSVVLAERRVQEAIAHLSHGIELSPHDSRLSVWGGVLATALRLSGNLSEAVLQAERACERDDRTYMPRVVLAGVHASNKDGAKARAALLDAHRIKPDLSDMQIAYLVGRRLAGDLSRLA